MILKIFYSEWVCCLVPESHSMAGGRKSTYRATVSRDGRLMAESMTPDLFIWTSPPRNLDIILMHLSFRGFQKILATPALVGNIVA